MGGILSAQVLKVFYITVFAFSTITNFARLRAGILVTKGSFIIVIAPSALENSVRLGWHFKRLQRRSNCRPKPSLGGRLPPPPVDPPLRFTFYVKFHRHVLSSSSYYYYYYY